MRKHTADGTIDPDMLDSLRRQRRELEREIQLLGQVREAVELDEHGIMTLMNSMMACLYRARMEPPVPRDALRDLVNLPSSITFVSDGTEELLEYAPEYFLGRPLSSLAERLHPDDIDPVDKAMQEALGKGETCRLSYRIRTFSGEYRWVWERCVGSYDAEGRLLYIQGLMTDIGEQHRQAYELRRDLTERHAPAGERYRFGSIIGKSAAMKKVYADVLESAKGDSPIVLYGESGTGKDLVARTVHSLSDRAGGAFVPVNCGAIPDYLFESEFFGYRRGAFTGAIRDKKGLMDLADRGTLFLDEIGEISLTNQAKLLRAVEDGGFTPLGSTEFRRPDVRIVAATNRDLAEEVRRGTFREDLYYRIHVIPIRIPPLRERGEDIFLLVDFFREQLSADAPRSIPLSVLAAMEKYDWPGNIRELQNVLRRYLTTGELGIPTERDTPRDVVGDVSEMSGLDLDSAVTMFERRFLAAELEKTHWNRTETARRLGISRKTLFRRLLKCGLS
ncbi:PAS domain S-box-containing protein [Desulfobaculum xiamenense]|uniref:PAS domain S-box-containing protein n=1 Tax=Desulfobaculum xiamenense TaxID=995050 RepID=A0A846QUI9_9BACT|nr:sigma 54-interacting transcriptional regulator [Desulfobaculum xiamenense]NJB68309.1 PAS domain S-box-containing protein [Desulfobaculum xiamenense]